MTVKLFVRRTAPKSRRLLSVRIGPQTGEFILGEQRFTPQLNEAEYLRSVAAKSSKKLRGSGSRQQVSSELEIGLTLGFARTGPLQRISAQFVKIGLRGSTWSKALEDQIKSFHDAWLKEQLGKPPYQFTWGKVISVIEPHWYSANIIIDYMRGKDPTSHAST